MTGPASLEGHPAVAPTRGALVVTLAVWVGYAALAATLSLWLHPIPLNESESDNFLRGLASLLQGGPCIDTYHPAHTVLTGWVVVKLIGCEPYTALRLLAAASGGAIVALTLALARRLGANALGAGLATAVIALHPGVLLFAMQASADAFATALMLATVLAAVRARSTGCARDTLLVGLLFGLAVGARFSCVGFAPALLAAVHRGRVVADLARLIGCAAIGYLPHGIVSTLQFGSPFVTDNWRNFVLKHGGFDAMLLLEPGYPNLFAFLRDHWRESLHLGATDFWHQMRGAFGQLLTGGLPAPGAWLVGGAALAALVSLVVRRRAGSVALALSFVCYLALICVSYATTERVLLPLFPVAAVALGSLVRRGAPWSSGLGMATLAVTIGSLAFHLPARLQRFIDAHPIREIEVARTMAERTDVELLATSYSYMPQFGPASTYVYPVAPGDRGQIAPYDHLRRESLRSGANAFLLGRRTSPDSYRALRATTPPADVRVILTDDDVVALVFEVFEDGGAAGRWFESFVVAPIEWRDGPLDLRVDLTEACDITRVGTVSVQLELSPRKGPLLDLPNRGPREWGTAWQLRPPPGSWQLATRLRLRDGRYVRGPKRELRVL